MSGTFDFRASSGDAIGGLIFEESEGFIRRINPFFQHVLPTGLEPIEPNASNLIQSLTEGAADRGMKVLQKSGHAIIGLIGRADDKDLKALSIITVP